MTVPSAHVMPGMLSQSLCPAFVVVEAELVGVVSQRPGRSSFSSQNCTVVTAHAVLR